MVILDGRKIAEEILQNLKKEIQNRHLRLAVILVGKDPVSQIFVQKKKEACKRIGIDFKLFQFEEAISSDLLREEIKKIGNDPLNSGVVIQLPIPFENPEEILNLIPEKKDIDVLSAKSFDKFSRGELNILPPTVAAVAILLKNYHINIKDKNIIVVGRGRLVGKPLAAWLKLQKIKYNIVDKNTKNIISYIKKADIIISGTGSPNLITGDMVKNDVVAVDVGSSIREGKAVGDIDFKSVSKKASYIAPVPGGVGPLTVACLLENLVRLNK